jgi:sec-independent protein translocase protein TatA
MSFVALFNLGGGEIILILALFLMLLAAKRHAELADGFRQGIKEFRKATREVVDEIVERVDRGRPREEPGHPILMALTLILGAVCLILLVYELSK